MVWYRFKPSEGDIFSTSPNLPIKHQTTSGGMTGCLPNRFVPRFTPVTTFNTASTVMTTYLVVCSVRQQQRFVTSILSLIPWIFVEVSKKPEPGSGNSGQTCGKKMDQKSRNFSWHQMGAFLDSNHQKIGRNFQDPKASGYFGPKSAVISLGSLAIYRGS